MYWIKSLDENCREGISKVLVGNKVDLEANRQVTSAEGKALADRNGMLFFETSAKTGAGVEDVFVTATKEIVKKNPGIVVAGKPKNISLTSHSVDKEGGCC